MYFLEAMGTNDCYSRFLTGCHLSDEYIANRDPETLPNVNAFQDEFTREFMASTVEVEDRFYTFQSKTEKYTMLFPKDAKVSTFYYSKSGDYTESFQYYSEDDAVSGNHYTFHIWHTNHERSTLKCGKLLFLKQ